MDTKKFAPLEHGGAIEEVAKADANLRRAVYELRDAHSIQERRRARDNLRLCALEFAHKFEKQEPTRQERDELALALAQAVSTLAELATRTETVSAELDKDARQALEFVRRARALWNDIYKEEKTDNGKELRHDDGEAPVRTRVTPKRANPSRGLAKAKAEVRDGGLNGVSVRRRKRKKASAGAKGANKSAPLHDSGGREGFEAEAGGAGGANGEG